MSKTTISKHEHPKTRASVLGSIEKEKRVWKLTACDEKGNLVYDPKQLSNSDVTDAFKQALYEGRATKISVDLAK